MCHVGLKNHINKVDLTFVGILFLEFRFENLM